MWNFTTATDLKTFYTKSGLDNPDAGTLSSISNDPLFVNINLKDFHLQTTSIACKAGENGSFMGAFPCDTTVTPPVTTTDTTPPVISITNPKTSSKLIQGTKVSIKTTFSDNVKVTKVEYYINNKILCSKTSSMNSCNWNVPKQTEITYTISVKGFDAANNSGTSSMTATSVKK